MVRFHLSLRKLPGLILNLESDGGIFGSSSFLFFTLNFFYDVPLEYIKEGVYYVQDPDFSITVTLSS